MQEMSIRNVSDLAADARGVLEVLLGRRLAEEEQVTVLALPARPAPSGSERQIAAQRLFESLNDMSDRARAVPEDEMEALIDEALEHVRGV